MSSSTSKYSYRDHKYSGKRKSRARVRPGFKCYHHGEDLSYEVIWRKKRKVNSSEDAMNKDMPCSRTAVVLLMFSLIQHVLIKTEDQSRQFPTNADITARTEEHLFSGCGNGMDEQNEKSECMGNFIAPSNRREFLVHSLCELTKKTIRINDKKTEENKEKPKKIKKPKSPKIYIPYVPKYHVQTEGKDASKYDFAAKRPPGGTSTFSDSVAHLVSNSLGIFFICLNELYVRNGLVGSMITSVILSCIMSYSIYSLTRSAHKVYGLTHIPQMTYPELAQAALDISTFPALKKYGLKFKYIVVGFIVTRYVAKCCVYQNVMARAVDQLITLSKRGANVQPSNIRIFVAALIIPTLLTCMLRTIEYTAPFYFISHVFMLLHFLYVLAYLPPKATKPFRSYETFTNATSFFGLCGGYAFAIDSSCAILTLENNMKAPKKIRCVIMISMSIVTVLMVSNNIISAYAWGHDTQAPITVKFSGIPYAALFQIATVVISYAVFPLEFWIPFQLLWVHIKTKYKEDKYWIYERIYRAAFLLAITLVSLIFPDLSGLMSFFGAVTVGVLNFIFPPIIEFLVDVRYNGYGRFMWKLVRLLALLLFGLIMVIGGAYSGFVNILERVY